ncbi:hypothetical protein ACXYMO_04675 [Arenibacterium sp. CAU 1754]
MIVFAALAGCTQVPEIGDRVPVGLTDAPYPALVPLDDSLTTPQDLRGAAQEVEESLATRVQRLKSKALNLQTPVVDEKTQTRMQQGVTL